MQCHDHVTCTDFVDAKTFHVNSFSKTLVKLRNKNIFHTVICYLSDQMYDKERDRDQRFMYDKGRKENNDIFSKFVINRY